MEAVKFAVLISAVLSLVAGKLKKSSLLILSAALTVGVLIYRSLQFGYPPIFDGFDTILLFTAVFTLTAVISKAEPVTAGVLSGLMLTGSLFLPTEIRSIPPIIRTPLFFLHVGTAILSYAVFISCSLISLINERAEVLKPFKWGFWLFTVSLFFGALWAFLAWGEVFMLDPKSLFSVGFWMFSAFVFHSQLNGRLRELSRPLIVLNGLLVLFLFLGVNFLFGGSHEF